MLAHGDSALERRVERGIDVGAKRIAVNRAKPPPATDEVGGGSGTVRHGTKLGNRLPITRDDDSFTRRDAIHHGAATVPELADRYLSHMRNVSRVRQPDIESDADLLTARAIRVPSIPRTRAASSSRSRRAIQR